MQIPKDDFTVGQAAKICQVAPRTVCDWVDSGQILGAWRMPRSNDRRIPRVGLLQFARRNNIERVVAQLEGELRFRVLAVVGRDGWADQLADYLGARPAVELLAVTCPFEATAALATWKPDLVVIDCTVGRANSLGLANLLANRQPRAVECVGLINEDDDPLDMGSRFTHVVKHGEFSAASLCDLVLAAASGKIKLRPAA